MKIKGKMEIYKKLLSIQLEYKACKNKENKFAGFKYRNAESMLQDLKPLLQREQLVLLFDCDIQPTDNENVFVMNGVYTLINAENTDEIIRIKGSVLTGSNIKGLCESQASGLSITYLKKYCLCNLLNVDDSSNDPDGLDTRDIKTRILESSSIKELMNVWKSLNTSEQESFRTIFTNRKQQLGK